MSHAEVDACIVYTTDSLYIFPTLVSAMQARRHCSVSKADVIIFCVDLDSETEDIFGKICEHEGILLIPIPRKIIEGQTAMLARLFLNEFVPRCYRQFLYLDSDVHIVGSLNSLIETSVQAGTFLAVNDPMTFLMGYSGPLGRSLERHLSSIGLNREQSRNYFNSGVLRISRDGWGKIGKDAWERFQQSGLSSRFPDQDALNLAGLENRRAMSLAWNFPIFMRYARVETKIKPRIEHFMSSPKPWHGIFPPWTMAAYRPYRKAIETYPLLSEFEQRMSISQRSLYHVQQRGKRMLETLTWGFSGRRLLILDYEMQSGLLCATDSPTLEASLLAN